MTYTRKEKPAPKTVTFNVSWINEDITIISAAEIPFLVSMKAVMGDYSEILDMLPIDLVEVLKTATGEEFPEFMQEWLKESRKEVELDSVFEDIMGKEKFNFGLGEEDK